MNVELYINNRLCDIESPEKLGITLKRVFIKPSELNIKDAQKSYDISLPATAVNNEIFNYANVEEVQGKFRIYGDARLYIGGVLIFDGKFRLSEITKDYYRGNLGVPAPITVKDIFGETMMNQAGKWMIDYRGIQSISKTNREKNPDCIYPFVLYGLLNKYDSSGKYYSDIKDSNGKTISYKQIYDKKVVHNIKDFPPSVNCIKMLEKIFANAEYKLTGSAMTDERLKNLYVSYKNPEDHSAVWGVDKTEISGRWTNFGNTLDIDGNFTLDNHYINTPDDSDDGYIIANLFNSKITAIQTDDPGMNITQKKIGNTYNINFKVPHSGLYKLYFNVKLSKGTVSTNMTSPNIMVGTLANQFYEIKVLRTSDPDVMEQQKMDNLYYRDNIDQLYNSPDNDYPQPHQVNFIDPKVNKHLICGFALGGDNLKDKYKLYVNPLTINEKLHNPMAISGGNSWTTREKLEEGMEVETYRAFSAVKSNGYVKTNNNLSIKFTVPLKEIPYGKETKTTRTDNDKAEGQISQVIWLEKGEQLTIVSVTPFNRNENIWRHHTIDFELSLTPFKKSKSWLTVDIQGKGDPNNPMVWTDKCDYIEGKLDLAGFLPSKIKINDWIDNFCKAFNLELTNVGEKVFELNLKKSSIVTGTSNIIDIDGRANTAQRRNESLKLPHSYELGFTVDTSEEGYYRSGTLNDDNELILNSGTDGKGIFYTGSSETNKIAQSSTFSYCWYKDIFDTEGNLLVSIPVITDHEIWDNDYDYTEMADKTYHDKAQRFWFQKGVFKVKIDESSIDLALVANKYEEKDQKLILDYSNEADSIMQNYFLILADNENNYTSISCRLTPDEYARLNKSLIRFNGDLYNIGEIDGYDPLGKNPCTLKLIRRII